MREIGALVQGAGWYKQACVSGPKSQLPNGFEKQNGREESILLASLLAPSNGSRGSKPSGEESRAQREAGVRGRQPLTTARR